MTPTETALLVVLGTIVVGYMAATGVLIGHLWGRLGTLEANRDELFRLREQDALTKRAQGDHIDTLEDHIRQELGPPPPPRPPGV